MWSLFVSGARHGLVGRVVRAVVMMVLLPSCGFFIETPELAMDAPDAGSPGPGRSARR